MDWLNLKESVFINGDCMEYMKTMPDNYVELAIVDPPYGIGLSMINKHGTQKKSIHHDKDWNNGVPDKKYFKELFRISRNQIIWGCSYFWPHVSSIGRIVHDKVMDDIKHTKLKYSEADIASCSMQNRVTIFRFQWKGNVQNGKINWNNDGLNGRIHPTQKPVQLYQWLLQNYAKQGDKILDTHVGSASSLIAFEIEGFDYVGFELDKDYFRDATKRLKQARITTIDMFKELKKPIRKNEEFIF